MGWWVSLMFSPDVIPSEARDLQWNVVPTVAPEDSSPRKLRRLGMTIKLTQYQPRTTLDSVRVRRNSKSIPHFESSSAIRRLCKTAN